MYHLGNPLSIFNFAFLAHLLVLNLDHRQVEVQIWQGDTSVFFSPSCDGVNFIRSTVTGSNTNTNMSDQASSRYNILYII